MVNVVWEFFVDWIRTFPIRTCVKVISFSVCMFVKAAVGLN